ncbi:LPS export ABC transporter periplasmic protein LptC [Elongatibacter sediminis]|uniref:LPS export ABC transporter periplasmic protein LptC n=1 Tax=Elongatibacter sediminis TaxID=3119006 RepID=A0AAW9RQ38_9GAMM
MIRRSTLRGVLALSALAALTWLAARDRSQPESAPIEDLDPRLNYALWDFSATLLDRTGKQNLRIDAPMLRNNARSQVGTIENPRIRIQQQADEWYITADSAVVTADREYVSLVGTVDLRRENRRTREVLEIRTRDVLLNVDPRTASTESAVTLIQEGDRVDAIGMKLDMKTNSYELLNEVRARYATP